MFRSRRTARITDTGVLAEILAVTPENYFKLITHEFILTLLHLQKEIRKRPRIRGLSCLRIVLKMCIRLQYGQDLRTSSGESFFRILSILNDIQTDHNHTNSEGKAPSQLIMRELPSMHCRCELRVQRSCDSGSVEKDRPRNLSGGSQHGIPSSLVLAVL